MERCKREREKEEMERCKRERGGGKGYTYV